MIKKLLYAKQLCSILILITAILILSSALLIISPHFNPPRFLISILITLIGICTIAIFANLVLPTIICQKLTNIFNPHCKCTGSICALIWETNAFTTYVILNIETFKMSGVYKKFQKYPESKEYIDTIETYSVKEFCKWLNNLLQKSDIRTWATSNVLK